MLALVNQELPVQIIQSLIPCLSVNSDALERFKDSTSLKKQLEFHQSFYVLYSYIYMYNIMYTYIYKGFTKLQSYFFKNLQKIVFKQKKDVTD